MLKRGKVCNTVFSVVQCEEGSDEAEALKYMRGVNLACVALASLAGQNWFGPAAESLALLSLEWGQPGLAEPEPRCQVSDWGYSAV